MSFLLKAIVICGLVAGLTTPAFAAEEKSAGKGAKGKQTEGRNVIKTVSKEITGQVSAISKNFIAVVYQANKNNEYEMGLYIEGVPELERVKDFAQIQAGDTVTVVYDEATEKDEEDKEFARHVARKIIFVRKAPPPPETEVLVSEEDDG